MTMTTKPLSALFAAAFLLASPALAHPLLKAAGPVPGSTVKVAPKNIRIQFSEDIELSFSGITLKNAKGEVQSLGEPVPNPSNRAQLTVPVTGALAPGKYTVEWHALGDDTHPQKGSFAFELKP
jgi:methionine-rich copper-binding protein CopC